MKTEFDVLYRYLTGFEYSNNHLREVYEVKFGKSKLNYISSMWIAIYFKDILSIIGLNKTLNIKLLFLVALLEISPEHKKIFPDKQSKVLIIIAAPFLVLAFIASLFFK
jgi:hypothetical protein